MEQSKGTMRRHALELSLFPVKPHCTTVVITVVTSDVERRELNSDLLVAALQTKQKRMPQR